MPANCWHSKYNIVYYTYVSKSEWKEFYSVSVTLEEIFQVFDYFLNNIYVYIHIYNGIEVGLRHSQISIIDFDSQDNKMYLSFRTFDATLKSNIFLF